jgi:hypothetical protein
MPGRTVLSGDQSLAVYEIGRVAPGLLRAAARRDLG